MTEIEYRDASPADEQFVDGLTRVTMQPHVYTTWDSEVERENYYQLNKFQQKGTTIIIYDSVDIGRVTVTRTSGKFLLDEIHILPEYQGKGIGRKVIESLLEEATSQNLSVELFVLKRNPVKGLYDSLGFTVYKEDRERFYMVKSV